ncbi:MAG: dihydropteroate synthase [Firmicutes bacterium]|nr:dihydropteroate synthase [Bacillota bacterium]
MDKAVSQGESRLKRLTGGRVLILDGAMGTMLQARGLRPGECPESWNLTHPDEVREVHRAYVEAGASVIQTNTFGGNRVKLSEYGLADQVREINQAAVRLAKEAAGDKALVYVSVGPTGLLGQPFGPADFDEFYEAFAEQVQAAVEAGADLIALETFSDLMEIRAALIAARGVTRLPVLAQMTFEPNGRTLMGTDAATAAVVLDSLGADAVGANCSGGPAELLAVISRMAEVTPLPLVVQPNAGLPVLIDGVTVFRQTPGDMAAFAPRMVEAGAWLVGGCCGTTPDHIRAVADALRGRRPAEREVKRRPSLASRSSLVLIPGAERLPFIGERINPTARKKLAEDIRENRFEMVLEEARGQVEAGTPILDVNMGVPGIDEAAAMSLAVSKIQAAIDIPISIDSANPGAIEAGLKAFVGKPLINSVNGKEDSLRTVLPLAKKYGAAVLGLTLDEQGIPETTGERLAIARRILDAALGYGIRAEDVFIDCLVQTASAQQSQALETLRAIGLIKSELGVGTVLGVSNVSHGLPAREVLNSTFLAMALFQGLDLAIMNPFDERMREALAASEVLLNRDPYCQEYIKRFQGAKAAPAVGKSAAGEVKPAGEAASAAAPEIDIKGQVRQAVIQGKRESIGALVASALAEGTPALDLVNQALIPGIDEVGRRYEAQTYFLPQLILGAETMKLGFEALRPHLEAKDQGQVGKIVLATVQGDIHDIGKNIVGVLLENYGFQVIDLGRDVPAAVIAETAEKEQAEIIGLSALMTTTMPRMAEVINEVKSRGLNSRVIIGGAVVTPEYAERIGADAWATDARDGVMKALQLIKDR